MSAKITLDFLEKCKNSPFLFENTLLYDMKQSKSQKEIHQAIMDPSLREIYVQGCHASGKTKRIARTAISLFYTYGPCKIFTLMPTGRQTKYAIWSEIHDEFNKAKGPLGGRLITQELRVDENWFMLGFSTKDPNMARSFHAPRIIILIDESQGVGDDIFTAIDGALAGGWTKLVCTGNPVSTSGRWRQECKMGNTKYKKVIRINGEEQENVLARKEIIPGLITHYWVDKMKGAWGIDSFFYQALVLGLFPDKSDDNLLSWEECKASQSLTNVSPGKKVLAIDVARYGTSETVMMALNGGCVMDTKAATGQDTMRTVGEAQIMLEENNFTESDEIVIDEIGVGGGVVDRLRELKEKRKIRPNIYAFRSNNTEDVSEPENFHSIRDEAHWHMRVLVQKGGAQMPNDDTLVNQATSIRYKVDSNKQIKIETKEELRKRKLPSPDRLDAFSMGLYRSVPKIFGSLKREVTSHSLILGPQRISSGYMESAGTY